MVWGKGWAHAYSLCWRGMMVVQSRRERLWILTLLMPAYSFRSAPYLVSHNGVYQMFFIVFSFSTFHGSEGLSKCRKNNGFPIHRAFQFLFLYTWNIALETLKPRISFFWVWSCCDMGWDVPSLANANTRRTVKLKYNLLYQDNIEP